MEYQLLDTGLGRKLEQVGSYRLIRPALNAFWKPLLPEAEWRKADAVFTRNSTGSGRWDFRTKLPEEWFVEWGGLTLKVKPTGFGHLGFFAEQYVNWAYFRSEACVLARPGARALNLFAYSGLGSLAMAQSGAGVCHLDAARGMVDWARENLAANPLIRGNIRWIVDDVSKFVLREIRRGASYDLIALDPPSFGRGSSKQVWKIEDDLPKLLARLGELRRPDRPFTVVLSCHSPGFSLLVLENLLREAYGNKGDMNAFEMSIPESTGRSLPSGVCVRYTVQPKQQQEA